MGYLNVWVYWLSFPDISHSSIVQRVRRTNRKVRKIAWNQWLELVAPQRIRNLLRAKRSVNNDIRRSANTSGKDACSGGRNGCPVPVWYPKVRSSGSVHISNRACRVELRNPLDQIVQYLLEEARSVPTRRNNDDTRTDLIECKIWTMPWWKQN